MAEVKCSRCHGNGGDSRGPCDRCGTLGVVERKSPEPSPQVPLNLPVARVPRNHRLAERVLIRLVEDGRWEVDSEGRIWARAVRCGRGRGGSGSVDRPVARRSAEKSMPTGYRMVRAMVDGVRVVGSAHRLVWQHFHGDIPEGMVINHRDGNKGNNRPENLEVVTYSENAKHAFRLGLKDQTGLRNPIAKLSDEQVREIRRRRCAGEALNCIAADFDVTFQTVSAISRGTSRASVRGAPIRRDDGRACAHHPPRGGRTLDPR